MPILVMGLMALAVFGVIGLMLTVAEFAGHHTKTPPQNSEPPVLKT
jgi:hypothetical protein